MKKPKPLDPGYIVTETAPGHINVVCSLSNRPYTRANQYGMFCDAEKCECESKSRDATENLMKIMRGLMT